MYPLFTESKTTYPLNVKSHFFNANIYNANNLKFKIIILSLTSLSIINDY